MEGGVERFLGNGGLLESLKPSPCNLSTTLFIPFPQSAPIVGNLDIGSPESQIVRVWIVRSPEHQQGNVNLNDLTSWVSAARCKPEKWRSGRGGLVASPMIKLAKNAEKEKRIGTVGISYIPLVGDLPDL